MNQFTTVKADAAAIDSAKSQLAYTRIVAPIAGRLAFGTWIRATSSTPAEPHRSRGDDAVPPISMVFTLPEQNLRRSKKWADATALSSCCARPRHDHSARGKLT